MSQVRSGIDGFRQDASLQFGMKRALCDEINTTAEVVAEAPLEPHDAEGIWAFVELDQQVDIASLVGLVPSDRPKNSNSPHAGLTGKLGLQVVEAL